MLSIDEAISHAREVANEQKRRSGICVQNDSECDKFSDCLKCAEEHEQIAEWMKELKELRELIQKNPFLVDMIKHDRIVRSKAIDDLSNILKKNYDYLPQILSQEAFDGYIDEYAEQLKAGVDIGT